MCIYLIDRYIDMFMYMHDITHVCGYVSLLARGMVKLMGTIMACLAKSWPQLWPDTVLSCLLTRSCSV